MCDASFNSAACWIKITKCTHSSKHSAFRPLLSPCWLVFFLFFLAEWWLVYTPSDSLRHRMKTPLKNKIKWIKITFSAEIKWNLRELIDPVCQQVPYSLSHATERIICVGGTNCEHLSRKPQKKLREQPEEESGVCGREREREDTRAQQPS